MPQTEIPATSAQELELASPQRSTLHIDGNGEPLAQYTRGNSHYLSEELVKHGSLLLRGFASLTPPSFRVAVEPFLSAFLESEGEHTSIIGEPHIFRPVRYAPERMLLWHNENSFNANWPEIIAFGCLRQADQGGESLLADSRAMLETLDPLVVAEFRARRMQYVRRMGLGVGRNWTEIFATRSKADAEKRCAEQGFQFRWLDEGVLETTCVRTATIFHRISGTESWFNQLQHWHQHCLHPDDRRQLLSLLGEDRMPRDCRFGDGGIIPDTMVDHIMATYGANDRKILLKPGEVLILDNESVAHGRSQYLGARELLVAMGRRAGIEKTPYIL
jgi:hypothetical protein